MKHSSTDASLKLGEEGQPPGEDQVIAEIAKVQISIMTGSAKATNKPIRRGQHPKAHGCVEAEFTVLSDIPQEFKVGVFREPKTYKALIRFSNGKSDSDLEPDVHGMAIKVFAVEGAKALSGDDSDVQDFILIDNDVFFANDAETLLGFMKASVAAELQNSREPIKAFAAMSERNKGTVDRVGKMRKKGLSSPLAVPYWSTVPYKLGDEAVKYAVKPAEGNQAATSQSSSVDYLREAMVERLTKQNEPAAFDFYVQMQTDAETMPIEDPTIAWLSPKSKLQPFRSPRKTSIRRSAKSYARNPRSHRGMLWMSIGL